MKDNKYRIIGYNLLNKFVNNEKKSEIIENSVYNYTINKSKKFNYLLSFDNELFRLTYKNKIMSLYVNMDINNKYIKNKTLIKKIHNNELNLNNIAFLPPHKIHPENWDLIIKRNKAKKELEYSKSIGTITDIYKCQRCKKNKCAYYESQTKSCDEPMTIFIKCINCRNSWNR